MITFRGWVFLLTGAGILVLGVLRMELATLLWGTLIIVLFLYTLIAGLVIRVQMRKQTFVVEPETDIVEVGMLVTFHVAVSRLAVRPPGYRLRLELGLRWEGQDLAATFPVKPGSQAPSVPAHRRGAFASTESRLVYEDSFAFIRIVRGDGSPLQVAVVPPIPTLERIDRLATPRGAKATHNRKRMASDEFLEIRPYVPGDDPRRLSWKHYAQLGDLMIRTGEPVPPPANELVCLVDAGWEVATARARRSTAMTALAVADSVVVRALSIIRGAVDSGDSVVVAAPGMGSPVTLPAGGPGLEPKAPLSAEAKSVLRAFADLTVGPHTQEPEIPGRLDGEALVIGSKASPSIATLVDRVRSRGASPRLLSVPPPLTLRRSTLSRILYREPVHG